MGRVTNGSCRGAVRHVHVLHLHAGGRGATGNKQSAETRRNGDGWSYKWKLQGGSPSCSRSSPACGREGGHGKQAVSRDQEEWDG